MPGVDVQSLHLLSIDLSSAPTALRAVLELGSADVQHWLERAKAAGVPLAIVCSPGSVDLYSTHAGRRPAFKPLLESLWSLARDRGGFERIRTTEASGHSVVRHLLRQAAGLESTEHGLSYAASIARACAQASRTGTLSDVLRELFQLATFTSDRSQAETELQAPHSTRASRQIEALSAERILEEELTAFRIAAANDQASRTADSPPSRSTFPASEAASSVRLRVTPFAWTPAFPRRRSS